MILNKIYIIICITIFIGIFSNINIVSADLEEVDDLYYSGFGEFQMNSYCMYDCVFPSIMTNENNYPFFIINGNCSDNYYEFNGINYTEGDRVYISGILSTNTCEIEGEVEYYYTIDLDFISFKNEITLSSENVIINTNKNVYKIGEKINLKIENNENFSIFSCGGPSLQRYVNGNWESFSLTRYEYIQNIPDVEIPCVRRFPAYSNLTYEYSTYYTVHYSEDRSSKFPLPAGKYRFVVAYSVEFEDVFGIKNYSHFYSNEFTIKEDSGSPGFEIIYFSIALISVYIIIHFKRK